MKTLNEEINNFKKLLKSKHGTIKSVLTEQDEKIFKDLFNDHVQKVIQKNLNTLIKDIKIKVSYEENDNDYIDKFCSVGMRSKIARAFDPNGARYKKQVVVFYPTKINIEFEKGGTPITMEYVDAELTGKGTGLGPCTSLYQASVNSSKEMGTINLTDNVINQILTPQNEELKDWINSHPEIKENLKTTIFPLKFSDANSGNKYSGNALFKFVFRTTDKCSDYYEYDEYFPLNQLIGSSANESTVCLDGEKRNVFKKPVGSYEERGKKYKVVGWNMHRRGHFFSRNAVVSFGWDDKYLDGILNKPTTGDAI
jgi:hypothetical protein